MWFLKVLELLPKILSHARRAVSKFRKQTKGRDRKDFFDKIRERLRLSLNNISSWFKDIFTSEVKMSEEDMSLRGLGENEDKDDDRGDNDSSVAPTMLLTLAAVGVGVSAYAGTVANEARPMTSDNNDKTPRNSYFSRKKQRKTESRTSSSASVKNGEKQARKKGKRRGHITQSVTSSDMEKLNKSTNQRTYTRANASVYRIENTDQITYEFSKRGHHVLGSGNVGNNLFNIRYIGQNKTGVDGGFGLMNSEGKDIGDFAIYSDVAYSASDFANTLENYANGKRFKKYRKYDGKITIREFFHIYAPKGDGKNDPDSYAESVAKAAGMKADDYVTSFKDNKKLFIAMAVAVAKRENRVTVSKEWLGQVWEWKYNGGSFPKQTKDGKEYKQKRVLDKVTLEPKPATDTTPIKKPTPQVTAQKPKTQTHDPIVKKANNLPKTDVDGEDVVTVTRAEKETKKTEAEKPQTTPIVKSQNIYLSSQTTQVSRVTDWNPNGI